MSVEIFVPKVQAIEAMEFTGGIENGTEIMSWIRDKGSTSVWSGAVAPTDRYCGMPEHIRVYKGRDAHSIIYIGDYVVLTEEGIIKTCRKQAFKSRFLKVVPTLEPELAEV